jgi:hypothetical protein
MRTNICLALAQITLAFLLATGVVAQTWDSGLEVINPQRMRVVIEDLSESARRLGLSEESIRAKVELQLRRYGIIATQDSRANYSYLYVRITVAGKGPYGFNLNVAWKRPIFYIVDGKSYETTATTWEKGGAGIASEIGGVQLIMSGIADKIDIFISNYLKANEMRVNPAESSLKSR